MFDLKTNLEKGRLRSRRIWVSANAKTGHRTSILSSSSCSRRARSSGRLQDPFHCLLESESVGRDTRLKIELPGKIGARIKSSVLVAAVEQSNLNLLSLMFPRLYRRFEKCSFLRATPPLGGFSHNGSQTLETVCFKLKWRDEFLGIFAEILRQ